MRQEEQLMAGKRIVILGGGMGGLTAANELHRQLGSEHRITLVERRSTHLFAPSLLWVLNGTRRPEQLTKELRLMVHPDVELVRADVQTIDPAAKRVVTDGRELAFDVLVIALGAELAPDAMPGFTAAFNFFDLDGAERLKDALLGFNGGRMIVAVTALPYKCPAAPYEAAFLIDDLLRRRGVRGKTDVAIFTPEPQPMPVAGPVMGQALTSLLAQRDIGYAPNRRMQAIDPARRELVFSDGTREAFDLLAAVPPHRPPQAVSFSPLANENGWIPVDRHSLRTAFDGVYALGDIASITLANGKPLPKAGVFAHAQARVIAQSIAAELKGGLAAAFDGTGYCWVELGGGQAAFASGDFYAEPSPDVQLRSPGRSWHLGKVLFERSWMGNRLERSVASLGLAVGSKVYRVSAAL
jgi:sulfide:quinone oxidoreductase